MAPPVVMSACKQTTAATQLVECDSGSPEPLGPSPGPSGNSVNFALYSEHASEVALEIYNDEDNSVMELNLDASKYKTGHVWHVLVEGLPLSGVLYAYKIQGEGGWETGGRCAACLNSAAKSNFVTY